MNLNLQRNSLWALGEVVASAFSLFLIYKIAISSLGIAALGIWSVVLATTSLGRVADIGLSAGLGRFIAATTAKNDRSRAIAYVETAIVSNVLLYILIAAAIAIPAYFGLAYAMSGASLVEARHLLPYSLVSFVLMGLTSATTGAIIGQHRSDQKSMITLLGLGVQFVITVMYVPRFGLLALAWGQIAQYTTLFIAGWLLFLRNHYGQWIFRFPYHWHKAVLNELMGFGMKVQLITFVTMVCDPLAKFLMSSMSGLEIVGLYEMGQRLVLQVRQLIVMPIQTIVPSISHHIETNPEQVNELYQKAVSLTVIFGFPLLLGVAVISPLISYLWLGRIDNMFVVLTVISCIGWSFNTLAAPAYLLGIGVGQVKWNAYGAILTTGGTGILGFIFGTFFGEYGVPVATSLMIACGSILTLIMNCKAMKIFPLPDAESLYQAKDRVFKMLKR
ncbi:MAG: oligosaccharide flippase family protein [Glaciimonas sp.]|nr:oligosaccharide flippase family protein [Glaciimonas sp.]